MKTRFDESYWDERYRNGATGWDLGEVSPPLKDYFDQLIDRKSNILIPGAGSGYEAGYLWNLGFINTHILDISRTALANFTSTFDAFPREKIHHDDFWDHTGQYDLIVEQTFFCAIDPKLREAYAEKVHSLLADKGKLVGLVWSQEMGVDSPPFGGSIVEYQLLFEELFTIDTMEVAFNSIPLRSGKELFIKLTRK
ncbi:MAG: SAM-dependent methyltransferase [Cyclobacteriaceae bacterium]